MYVTMYVYIYIYIYILNPVRASELDGSALGSSRFPVFWGTVVS